MNHRVRRLTVALWLIIGTLPAWAHPGHGDGGSGPQHYLSEPVHAIGWWGTVAVASGALVVWAFGAWARGAWAFGAGRRWSRDPR